MNFTKRASIAARHMVKHKTMGGQAEEMKDSELEKELEVFTTYETRVKTLVAMTMDARAQLAEAFLQLGFATQCFVELSDPSLDLTASAAAAVGGALPDTQAEEALHWRAQKSKIEAGLLQESFHASFGEALQAALLTPLESEVEQFEKTRAEIAKQHEASLEASHYNAKLQTLQKKESDKEKLQRNADKASEATIKLNDAKAQLRATLAQHDVTRRDLITARVEQLKKMLHSFCEKALTSLSVSDAEARAKSLDLDRYNIYGDVNVESALSKMRRGIASSSKNAGKSADSVAMRLAYMKRHAATTFTREKNVKDAYTEDPIELEVNEMASRYEKAWSVLERLPVILEALQKWYDAGFAAFTGVAGELAAAVAETDAPSDKAVVLTFHAALDEVRSALQRTFIERVLNDVITPLNDGRDQFKELPDKLRDRRVKALEREHYTQKVAALEKRSHNEKASDAAREKNNERWERNKTKATEADGAAKAETQACRQALLAFDTMFKTRVQETAQSLDSLQRDFYLDMAAKVAAKLQLGETANDSRLQSLMAQGVIVPQSGMTVNRNAALSYQRTASEASSTASAAALPIAQPVAAQVPAPPQARPPPPSYAPRPPAPVPVVAAPGSYAQPAASSDANNWPPQPQNPTPRWPPPASQPRPPAPAVPAGSTTGAPPPEVAQLLNRKASLSASEADQVRRMMQATVGAPAAPPAPATFAIPPQQQQAPVAVPPPAPPVAVAPPPPPAPRGPPPGMIRVKALYDFDAVQAGDLAFKMGDIILTDEAAFRAAGSAGGWITGDCHGASGVFPSNYVQPI